MRLDLTELKKRFQPRSVLALSVEPDRLAASLVHRDNGSCRVIASVTVPIAANAPLEAPEQVGRELAAALEVAAIRERRCVVCIPPGWAMTASSEMPEVSPEDLRGYFELRAEREFSMQTADLRLAHCAYSVADGKPRATLAAVSAKRMEAIEKLLEAAGCRAASISLALGGCLGDGTPALHFLVGAGRTDAVVTAGGGIAALRSLAGPGAEGAPFDSAAFGREIRITLGRLPEPVRQQVRRAEFRGAPEIVKKLADEMRDQLGRMNIEPPVEVEGGQETPNDAVEFAIRHLLKQAVPFEFVTVEANRWQTTYRRLNTRRGRQIALVAVAVAALLIAVFGIRARMESSLQDEWAGMRTTVAELDGLQQKIRRFRPWFESNPQNLGIFESLIAAFPDAGEVWAKSVQIDEGSKITCAGFARNQPALMGFLDRLRGRPGVTALQVQQLRGDNPIQFSVTYKWELKHE